MRDPIANLVHSVLDHGLHLHDRLEGGANVSLLEEQAALKKMLLIDPNFDGGSAHQLPSADEERIPSADEATVYRVRYLLTCWLDELFVGSAAWSGSWSKQNLEAALYNTCDGAWKFWQYANQAEADADADALEVCRLCVLLGFRGKQAGHPEWVRGWLTSAGEKWARHRRAWQAPAALEPPTYVPPLTGRERLQRMVLVSGMTAAVLVPFVVLLLARHF